LTIGRAFPAAARSVREARDFATAALSGTPAEARADVGLMVSELTTNALQHALSSFRLTVDQTPSEICVEVADYGTGSPRLQSVGPDAPYGRGLQIVNLLSTQWGVRDESEFGKTVWFTVALAAEN
jgi:anti-sigma regulatory factor (Ser/Thr protein kinase)